MQPIHGPAGRHAGLALIACAAVIGSISLGAAGATAAVAGRSLQQATATATSALPPPAPTPTQVPPGPTPPGVAVCPQIQSRVPAAAVQAALANPARVAGYRLPRDAGKHAHQLYNPPRTWLSIHAYSKPYHPLFNSLEFKAGCP